MDNLRIHKIDGKVIITPSVKTKDIAELLNDIQFSFNDLQVHLSGEDGWTYLYDANTDTVGMLDNYGVDLLQELMDGKKVEVSMNENSSIYEEYEWNTEY